MFVLLMMGMILREVKVKAKSVLVEVVAMVSMMETNQMMEAWRDRRCYVGLRELEEYD